jgi:hypothetical protein
VRSGGILIFDVWYGPAVLGEGPSDRVKSIPTDEGPNSALGFRATRCPAHLTVETHLMRFFFPLELNLFLECCGFAPIRLGVFRQFDRDPDETTWNVLGVARVI